ncbi:hypothetical protein Bbelb_383510, partial [Branchiostoma belcheri]
CRWRQLSHLMRLVDAPGRQKPLSQMRRPSARVFTLVISTRQKGSSSRLERTGRYDVITGNRCRWRQLSHLMRLVDAPGRQKPLSQMRRPSARVFTLVISTRQKGSSSRLERTGRYDVITGNRCRWRQLSHLMRLVDAPGRQKPLSQMRRPSARVFTLVISTRQKGSSSRLERTGRYDVITGNRCRWRQLSHLMRLVDAPGRQKPLSQMRRPSARVFTLVISTRQKGSSSRLERTGRYDVITGNRCRWRQLSHLMRLVDAPGRQKPLSQMRRPSARVFTLVISTRQKGSSSRLERTGRYDVITGNRCRWRQLSHLMRLVDAPGRQKPLSQMRRPSARVFTLVISTRQKGSSSRLERTGRYDVITGNRCRWRQLSHLMRLVDAPGRQKPLSQMRRPSARVFTLVISTRQKGSSSRLERTGRYDVITGNRCRWRQLSHLMRLVDAPGRQKPLSQMRRPSARVFTLVISTRQKGSSSRLERTGRYDVITGNRCRWRQLSHLMRLVDAPGRQKPLSQMRRPSARVFTLVISTRQKGSSSRLERTGRYDVITGNRCRWRQLSHLMRLVDAPGRQKPLSQMRRPSARVFTLVISTRQKGSSSRLERTGRYDVITGNRCRWRQLSHLMRLVDAPGRQKPLSQMRRPSARVFTLVISTRQKGSSSRLERTGRYDVITGNRCRWRQLSHLMRLVDAPGRQKPLSQMRRPSARVFTLVISTRQKGSSSRLERTGRYDVITGNRCRWRQLSHLMRLVDAPGRQKPLSQMRRPSARVFTLVISTRQKGSSSRLERTGRYDVITGNRCRWRQLSHLMRLVDAPGRQKPLSQMRRPSARVFTLVISTRQKGSSSRLERTGRYDVITGNRCRWRQLSHLMRLVDAPGRQKPLSQMRRPSARVFTLVISTRQKGSSSRLERTGRYDVITGNRCRWRQLSHLMRLVDAPGRQKPLSQMRRPSARVFTLVISTRQKGSSSRLERTGRYDVITGNRCRWRQLSHLMRLVDAPGRQKPLSQMRRPSARVFTLVISTRQKGSSSRLERTGRYDVITGNRCRWRQLSHLMRLVDAPGRQKPLSQMRRPSARVFTLVISTRQKGSSSRLERTGRYDVITGNRCRWRQLSHLMRLVDAPGRQKPLSQMRRPSARVFTLVISTRQKGSSSRLERTGRYDVITGNRCRWRQLSHLMRLVDAPGRQKPLSQMRRPSARVFTLVISTRQKGSSSRLERTGRYDVITGNRCRWRQLSHLMRLVDAPGRQKPLSQMRRPSARVFTLVISTRQKGSSSRLERTGRYDVITGNRCRWRQLSHLMRLVDAPGRQKPLSQMRRPSARVFTLVISTRQKGSSSRLERTGRYDVITGNRCRWRQLSHLMRLVDAPGRQKPLSQMRRPSARVFTLVISTRQKGSSSRLERTGRYDVITGNRCRWRQLSHLMRLVDAPGRQKPLSQMRRPSARVFTLVISTRQKGSSSRLERTGRYDVITGNRCRWRQLSHLMRLVDAPGRQKPLSQMRRPSARVFTLVISTRQKGSSSRLERTGRYDVITGNRCRWRQLSHLMRLVDAPGRQKPLSQMRRPSARVFTLVISTRQKGSSSRLERTGRYDVITGNRCRWRQLSHLMRLVDAPGRQKPLSQMRRPSARVFTLVISTRQKGSSSRLERTGRYDVITGNRCRWRQLSHLMRLVDAPGRQKPLSQMRRPSARVFTLVISTRQKGSSSRLERTGRYDVITGNRCRWRQLSHLMRLVDAPGRQKPLSQMRRPSARVFTLVISTRQKGSSSRLERTGRYDVITGNRCRWRQLSHLMRLVDAPGRQKPLSQMRRPSARVFTLVISTRQKGSSSRLERTGRYDVITGNRCRWRQLSHLMRLVDAPGRQKPLSQMRRPSARVFTLVISTRQKGSSSRLERTGRYDVITGNRCRWRQLSHLMRLVDAPGRQKPLSQMRRPSARVFTLVISTRQKGSSSRLERTGRYDVITGNRCRWRQLSHLMRLVDAPGRQKPLSQMRRPSARVFTLVISTRQKGSSSRLERTGRYDVITGNRCRWRQLSHLMRLVDAPGRQKPLSQMRRPSARVFTLVISTRQKGSSSRLERTGRYDVITGNRCRWRQLSHLMRLVDAPGRQKPLSQMRRPSARVFTLVISTRQKGSSSRLERTGRYDVITGNRCRWRQLSHLMRLVDAPGRQKPLSQMRRPSARVFTLVISTRQKGSSSRLERTGRYDVITGNRCRWRQLSHLMRLVDAPGRQKPLSQMRRPSARVFTLVISTRQKGSSSRLERTGRYDVITGNRCRWRQLSHLMRLVDAPGRQKPLSQMRRPSARVFTLVISTRQKGSSSRLERTGRYDVITGNRCRWRQLSHLMRLVDAPGRQKPLSQMRRPSARVFTLVISTRQKGSSSRLERTGRYDVITGNRCRWRQLSHLMRLVDAPGRQKPLSQMRRPSARVFTLVISTRQKGSSSRLERTGRYDVITGNRCRWRQLSHLMRLVDAPGRQKPLSQMRRPSARVFTLVISTRQKGSSSRLERTGRYDVITGNRCRWRQLSHLMRLVDAPGRQKPLSQMRRPSARVFTLVISTRQKGSSSRLERTGRYDVITGNRCRWRQLSHLMRLVDAPGRQKPLSQMRRPSARVFTLVISTRQKGSSSRLERTGRYDVITGNRCRWRQLSHLMRLVDAPGRQKPLSQMRRPSARVFTLVISTRQKGSSSRLERTGRYDVITGNRCRWRQLSHLMRLVDAPGRQKPLSQMRRPSARVFTLVISTRQKGSSSRLERTGRYDVITGNRCRWRQLSHLMRLVDAPGRQKPLSQMRRPSARVFTLVISTRQKGSSSRLERTGRYDVITGNRCRWRQLSHLMRLVDAPGRQKPLSQMRRPSARVFTLVISTRQKGSSSRLERTGRYDVITGNRCRWRQLSHLMRLVDAPGRQKPLSQMRRPSARVFTLVISTRQKGSSSRLERTGRYDVITGNRCRWRQLSHLMRLVDAPGRQKPLSQMRRPSARVFTLVISTRQKGSSSRLERTGRYDVITGNRCRWRQLSHLMRLVDAPGRQV